MHVFKLLVVHGKHCPFKYFKKNVIDVRHCPSTYTWLEQQMYHVDSQDSRQQTPLEQCI